MPLRSAIYTQAPKHRATASGFSAPHGAASKPSGPEELSRLEHAWPLCVDHWVMGRAVSTDYLADLAKVSRSQAVAYLLSKKAFRTGGKWRLVPKVNTYQPNPVRGIK